MAANHSRGCPVLDLGHRTPFMQLYLKGTHREELANRTIETLQQEERLAKDAVIDYAESYFAVFELDEYAPIILDLKARAREGKRRSIEKF
jgi:hypothetical protein